MKIENSEKYALKVIECITNQKFYEVLKQEQNILDNDLLPGLIFVIENNLIKSKIMFDLSINESEKAIIDFMRDNSIIFSSNEDYTQEALIKIISSFINDFEEEVNTQANYYCKLKFIYENSKFSARFEFINKPTEGMLMFLDEVDRMINSRAEEITNDSHISLIHTPPPTYSVQ